MASERTLQCKLINDDEVAMANIPKLQAEVQQSIEEFPGNKRQWRDKYGITWYGLERLFRSPEYLSVEVYAQFAEFKNYVPYIMGRKVSDGPKQITINFQGDNSGVRAKFENEDFILISGELANLLRMGNEFADIFKGGSVEEVIGEGLRLYVANKAVKKNG